MTQVVTVPRLVQILLPKTQTEVRPAIGQLLRKHPSALIQELEREVLALKLRILQKPCTEFHEDRGFENIWELTQLLGPKLTQHHLIDTDPYQSGVPFLKKKTGKTVLLTLAYFDQVDRSSVDVGKTRQLLHHWNLAVRWWWAGQIVRDLVLLIHEPPRKLTEALGYIEQRPLQNRALPDQPIETFMGLSDCTDQSIQAVSERCSVTLWDSGTYGTTAADEFDNWCKGLTIADLLAFDLDYTATKAIVDVVSMPMTHLEIRLEWVQKPTKTNYRPAAYLSPAHTCDKSFWVPIPMKLLLHFDSQASEATREALIRLIMKDAWHRAQLLLGSDFY